MAARAAATGWRVTLPTDSGRAATKDGRLDVRKTYKLYVGGAFPRSESGRYYLLKSAHSRKTVLDRKLVLPDIEPEDLSLPRSMRNRRRPIRRSEIQTAEVEVEK